MLLKETPTIAKATIVGHLGDYPSRQTLLTSVQMIGSEDADIRRQALQALRAVPIQYTIKQLFPALKDPVKIVRLEAASILAATPRGDLAKEQRELLDNVTEEYRQSLLFSAERPESQLSLAQLYRQLGQFDKAETAFKEAIALQPQFIPAYINYAHFLQQRNESAAFEILQSGLKQVKAASLYHALGLWYVRNGDKVKGIRSIYTAIELAPDNATYQYVYAVAHGDKDPARAIQILETTLQKHRGNLNVLKALASYYKQLGDDASADKYRREVNNVMRIKIR